MADEEINKQQSELEKFRALSWDDELPVMPSHNETIEKADGQLTKIYDWLFGDAENSQETKYEDDDDNDDIKEEEEEEEEKEKEEKDEPKGFLRYFFSGKEKEQDKNIVDTSERRAKRRKRKKKCN